MKFFVVSFVALTMGLVLGLGFLYTEDNSDVDAQIEEYEWDVLPGVPIRYGALSSSIKITQGWHSARVCRFLPSPHDDCSLDLGQVDGQPVHAVFRRSSEVDLMAIFTLTSSDPKECRSVTAEIIEMSTGRTVATVYYVHVLMSIAEGTRKNLSSLSIPGSDNGKIGTIAVPHHKNYFLEDLANDPDPDTSQFYQGLQEIYKNKPMSQWDGENCPNSGPHLHQMVIPDSTGIVQQNRDDNDPKKGISMDYTYISPHMWLWKIALKAPAITATRAPSKVHPSKLTVSTITIKRVGLPEASTGLGGTVKTNPVDGPYVAGEEVTLTAEENPGYIFARWDPNSDCSDHESPTCSITLPGGTEKTITATFAPRTILTVRTQIEGASTSGGGGDISPMRGTHAYALGEKVTVTTTTAPGYHFSRWGVTGGCDPLDRGTTNTGNLGLTRSCTVTMTTDRTVIAYYVGLFGLTIPSSSEGSIECTVGGTTTNCEGATTNYASGTKVTLTAAPDDSDTHEFSRWTVSTGGGSGASGAADTEYTANPLTITLDADTTVTATFTAKATPTPTATPEPTPQCTLTVRAGSGGKVKVGATTTAASSASWTGDCGTKLSGTTGANAMPSATANSGYRFTGWSSSPSGWTGGCSGTGTCTPTVGSATGTAGTYTLTASFAPRVVVPPPTPQCTLTVRAGSGGKVKVGATTTAASSASWTGDCGTKLSGTTGANAMPSATANSGYRFTGWSSSPSGWTGGCSGTGTCTPTVGSATGTAGTYTLTASFTPRIVVPPPDPDPPTPPTGGTHSTSSSTVTRWGWTANCRRGGGSGNDNGTKYALQSAAAAVARVWINRNCPRAGGTYEIIDTTTYYWSATCRIGAGSHRRSGYTSWSAAVAAGRAWISADCPKGGGTSSTSSTTQWYADVICVHGDDFTVGPYDTETEARTIGEFTARTLCPQASVSGDAPTPTAQASDDDVGGEEGHSAYSVRSATTYGWMARCTNGGGRGSRSGYTALSAAASAGRAWVAANCEGGGRLTTGSNTTHGWEGSCHAGGGTGSGSGHEVRSAAATEAGAWITANCAGGGTFDTPSTPTTTWSWSASCNSGSGSQSGSGLASESAADSAAQAWITANCGG